MNLFEDKVQEVLKDWEFDVIDRAISLLPDRERGYMQAKLAFYDDAGLTGKYLLEDLNQDYEDISKRVNYEKLKFSRGERKDI